MCLGHAVEMWFLDIVNDRALEQLVVESIRRVAILHLVLSGSQDLVRNAEFFALVGNSDHNATKFSI